MVSDDRACFSRCSTGKQSVKSVIRFCMKLFEPNNLSKSHPEFTPFAQISAFVAANVSANNFKIETPSAKYFLKSREQSATEKTRHEAELTFALGELGQKVPRIIRS